jgi:DNA/RNA-binding domain of Phe-tRNA-synthetase-like protein
MNIAIDRKLKEITPLFNVGILVCDIEIKNDDRITKIISELENKISNEISIEEVVNLDVIKESRDAYKLYGKDPSRYRLAVESLYRRLSKGNRLYRINNVVDLGNILSLYTRKSIAILDYDKIVGDVLIRLGKSSDNYYGIGRGKINIANIPVYEDDLGPFGSSTSDTERTMITPKTKRLLILIISFIGEANLTHELDYAKELYREYANAHNFSKKVI